MQHIVILAIMSCIYSTGTSFLIITDRWGLVSAFGTSVQNVDIQNSILIKLVNNP